MTPWHRGSNIGALSCGGKLDVASIVIKTPCIDSMDHNLNQAGSESIAPVGSNIKAVIKYVQGIQVAPFSAFLPASRRIESVGAAAGHPRVAGIPRVAVLPSDASPASEHVARVDLFLVRKEGVVVGLPPEAVD